MNNEKPGRRKLSAQAYVFAQDDFGAGLQRGRFVVEWQEMVRTEKEADIFGRKDHGRFGTRQYFLFSMTI